jgi:hypothetical protein
MNTVLKPLTVFVLNLPNSRSTRRRLMGKPSACCWIGLV